MDRGELNPRPKPALCKGSSISCLKGLQLLSENLEFKSQPLHYLASFFLRLRLTVHGCGAKNTASIHTKSFQGFDGIRKEKE
jgi:hypothetical protein